MMELLCSNPAMLVFNPQLLSASASLQRGFYSRVRKVKLPIQGQAGSASTTLPHEAGLKLSVGYIAHLEVYLHLETAQGLAKAARHHLHMWR